MRLQLRICLYLQCKTAEGGIQLVCHIATISIIHLTAAQSSYGLHHIFVQIDGFVDQRSNILQDLDSLFKVVVYLGCVALNFLLKLLEMVLRLYLHKEEDKSGYYE